MKSSVLLKPNKINYSHNTKTNAQNKVKNSSRNGPILQQKSSMSDLMMIPSHSRKSVIASQSNKENYPRNVQIKDAKKQQASKDKKASDMYTNQKMTRMNRIYRNQSMHITRVESLDEISEIPRMNNSSISQKQNIQKKKKLSKPLLQNASSMHHHNAAALNRSSLSDKSILVKEKKQENLKSNFESCKNLQSKKEILPSKSSQFSQKRISTGSKSGVYLIKNNNIPIETQSKEQKLSNQINTKNQPKSKSTTMSKDQKVQQAIRRIKRTKLEWLIVINNFYTTILDKNKTNPQKPLASLFDVVQYLKNFDKKSLSLEQYLWKQGNQNQLEERVSLAQLLKFLKFALQKDRNFIPHIVFKTVSKDIDAQKTKISFNCFGKLIFSHENIEAELQKDQKRNKIAQNSEKQHEVKNYSHSTSLKQDDDIVQTARFQNYQNHSFSINSVKQQNEDKKDKKKNVNFMKEKSQQLYLKGIDNLINAKLAKGRCEQKNSSQSTLKAVDKSFSKKNSSNQVKDYQKSKLKIQQQNQIVNKEQSRSSIEDFSQILQVNEIQKPLVTSFNVKYNSRKDSSFSDPFPDDSLMESQQCFREIDGMQDIYEFKGDGLASIAIGECRLQALNMNSSQMFLESVILSNLYHTNFNISFSDEPLDNSQSFMKSYKQNSSKQQFLKLQDLVQEIENVLKSMKNIFSLDCDSITDNKNLFKSINKESIKIQDLTQIQDFLSQFIDYRVFRKQIKGNSECQYFNAVKLTQGNLTSLQTKRAAENIVKSNLITKYFSYMEGIRINQGPFFIQNIETLIGDNSKIKILNLSNNEIKEFGGLIKVIECNLRTLQFLNISNNLIDSLQSFFGLMQSENEEEPRSFVELKQLHLKNNRIRTLNYKIPTNAIKPIQKHFPSLQLLDFRSNLLSKKEKSSIQNIINQSPHISIMSLKLNPLMMQKSLQRTEIEKIMNKRSIYEYDSLQMMSAYIKYKDITFSDSSEGCCSLIQQEQGKGDNEQKLVGMSGKDDGKGQEGNFSNATYKATKIRNVDQPSRRKIRSIKNIQINQNGY